MSSTIIRTQSNLQVIFCRPRYDHKVEIRFAIYRAGVYYNVPAFTKARNAKYPNGFLLTPALADPLHVKDPIFVAFPGQTFFYVWDAQADGYALGEALSLLGWTFQLSYVDYLCCDEIEGGFTEPPEDIPPWDPNPPPPTDIPIPVPSEPPIIGIPPLPPLNPAEPPTVPLPPPEPSEPPAGREDPYSPFWEPFDRLYWELRDLRTEDGLKAPILPDWFFVPDAPETVRQASIAPPPPTEPEAFVYKGFFDSSPLPTTPFGVGISPTVAPDSLPPLLEGTQVTADSYGLEEYRPLDPYPSGGAFEWFFGVLNGVSGLRVRPLVPVPGFPSDRGTLYYVVENTNPDPVEGIYSIVLARETGQPAVIVQPAEKIQATGEHQAHRPPGVLPAGTNAGRAVCIDWRQFPTRVVQFLVVLLNQNLQPITAGSVVGSQLVTGTVPPAGSQVVEYLGSGVRSIAALPSGTLPKYEGSVNAVGYEDTYVFTAVRATVAIVVKASADALQTKFDPVMDIFDVNDMDTPVATCTGRFQVGGADIEPETHVLGFKDTSHVLEVGRKYAIVVRHRTPYYSRRWTFMIFHEETIVETGGNLSIDGDGNLAGELSCSYGRQAIKVLNLRTGEAVFVLTNERGATTDLQRDTTEGTSGRRLAVRYGDVLEIIRPGPGVLYRRHGDLIGKVTL